MADAITATDMVQRTDLRRRNALALAGALMVEIDDIIEDHHDRTVLHHRLFEALYRNGAAWTTDAERAEQGLEPRDELGWTPSERVALKHQEAQALLMMPLPIMQEPLGEEFKDAIFDKIEKLYEK